MNEPKKNRVIVRLHKLVDNLLPDKTINQKRIFVFSFYPILLIIASVLVLIKK